MNGVSWAREARQKINMITYSEFKKLCRKGNLAAVSKTIPADLETPVSCFLKLADSKRHAFFLESAEQGEKTGRYSFIGSDPCAVFENSSDAVTVTENGKTVHLPAEADFMDLLEKRLHFFKLANPEELPNFCGGFVGYLSYENVRKFETIHLKKAPGPEVPEALFFLTREFVVFDHFRKTLSIVVLADTSNPSQSYAAAQKKIDQQLARLKTPLKIKRSPRQKIDTSKLHSNITPKEFYDKVKKVQSYIRAGDCIQVVLSQRFSFPHLENDFQIYRALRSVNPSPYMFYFKSGHRRLIGSSPEMLVRKKGLDAEVRPIAGTRPRGKTPQEDIRLEENLKKSKKEMAEHLMLVDLGRNDLGRVSEFNSVKVREFARVERYSHVMHLVSDVSCRLKKGFSAFDLLKATFPAGTVSGAPKIRAMQIIDELEPERRGPYAGCLGYFSFNRDMDMCITIRTLVLDGKKIYLQAGAGIVKDSSPQKEFQETVNKAKALVRALALQSEFS